MKKPTARTQVARYDFDGNPEYGFVTSANENTVYCRFWKRGREGEELRTKANSEGCDLIALLPVPVATKQQIDKAIQENKIFMDEETNATHFRD